jgi:hypothetical protein
MKKKLLATTMMCFVMMSAQAQVYGYDDYVRMPTMDLYDPGVMNMAIRAQAEAAARQQEMIARRQEMFRFYAFPYNVFQWQWWIYRIIKQLHR